MDYSLIISSPWRHEKTNARRRAYMFWLYNTWTLRGANVWTSILVLYFARCTPGLFLVHTNSDSTGGLMKSSSVIALASGISWWTSIGDHHMAELGNFFVIIERRKNIYYPWWKYISQTYFQGNTYIYIYIIPLFFILLSFILLMT